MLFWRNNIFVLLSFYRIFKIDTLSFGLQKKEKTRQHFILIVLFPLIYFCGYIYGWWLIESFSNELDIFFMLTNWKKFYTKNVAVLLLTNDIYFHNMIKYKNIHEIIQKYVNHSIIHTKNLDYLHIRITICTLRSL